MYLTRPNDVTTICTTSIPHIWLQLIAPDCGRSTLNILIEAAAGAPNQQRLKQQSLWTCQCSFWHASLQYLANVHWLHLWREGAEQPRHLGKARVSWNVKVRSPELEASVANFSSGSRIRGSSVVDKVMSSVFPPSSTFNFSRTCRTVERRERRSFKTSPLRRFTATRHFSGILRSVGQQGAFPRGIALEPESSSTPE